MTRSKYLYFHLDLSTTKELLLKTKLAGSCSEEPPMFVEDPLNAENYYVQLTEVCLIL